MELLWVPGEIQRGEFAKRRSVDSATYRLWVDWNMAVGSCLSDSPSTSFGALAGKGSRGRLWDWESPSPGHPVLQSVDNLREWHRICEGKRIKEC